MGPKEGRNATSPLHSRGSPTKGTKSKRAQKRVEILHHPCILGGPQQRGQNQSGTERGQKCYITPSFSGLPNKEGQDQNVLPQPCLFKSTKVGGNAMSPLHSRGAPTKGTKSKRAQKMAEMLHHPCILGGLRRRGTKSELAGSTVLFQGQKSGRKCYITPAFSGVQNKREKIKAGSKEGGNATSPLHSWGSPSKGTKSKRPQKRAEMLHHPSFSGLPNKGGQDENWLAQPCLFKGTKVGGNAMSPLHSRGAPKKGTKSKRAQKRAEMLHHPFILGGPQQNGKNQSGPKRGQKCYITPAFSGVQNKGDKIKAGPKEGRNATSPLHSRGYPTKGTKSKWAQKRVEMLHHPCILGGPQQRGQNQSGSKRGQKCYITPSFSGLPNKGGQDQNWLAQPCLFKGTKVGGNAMSPLHSRGAPTKGTKSKRAKKRAQMLHHPCILGGLRQRGTKSELAASTVLFQGQKSERKCYITPAFSGVQKKREKIKAGPKEGGNATSPLHSPGSPTKGTKSKGAQKRVEMLRLPCILGGAQHRGQNQSGTKRGQKCYITPELSGIPNKGGQHESGPKRGQKCYINLALSGVRNKRGENQSGPKRGRKCYITPAFSGIPNKGDGIKAGPKEGRNAKSPLHSRGSPTKVTKSKRA